MSRAQHKMFRICAGPEPGLILLQGSVINRLIGLVLPKLLPVRANFAETYFSVGQIFTKLLCPVMRIMPELIFASPK